MKTSVAHIPKDGTDKIPANNLFINSYVKKLVCSGFKYQLCNKRTNNIYV